MCIGSDFNNIISSAAFAPKNMSIFSLKAARVDLIKGTYIFFIFFFIFVVEWAVCKLRQLIQIPDWPARNSESLSVGEEQILPGCSGISINGRLPGS